MERESDPHQPMCVAGCGFYGNPAQDGMCSVCFKDVLRKKYQSQQNRTPGTDTNSTCDNSSQQTSEKDQKKANENDCNTQ